MIRWWLVVEYWLLVVNCADEVFKYSTLGRFEWMKDVSTLQHTVVVHGTSKVANVNNDKKAAIGGRKGVIGVNRVSIRP